MAQNSLEKFTLHYEYVEERIEIKKAIRRLKDRRRRAKAKRNERRGRVTA